jgi:hypothetical protein
MRDPAEFRTRLTWAACAIALAGALAWAGTILAAGPAT